MDGRTYTCEQVIALLEDTLGERPIAFHVVFARLFDSVTAGLMFSQMLYWSKLKKESYCLSSCRLCPDGWRYRTEAQWKEDTHLSREELTTARKKIIGCGAAEFDRAGRDGVRHFLINKVVLVDLLHGHAETRRLLAVVETHRSTLEKISTANYSRAVKLERKAEKFSYVDVYVRERGVCYLCGEEITKGPGQRGEHLQFDHVIALEDGGEHTSANVKPTHAKCHQHKTGVRETHTPIGGLQVHSPDRALPTDQTAGLPQSLIKRDSERIPEKNPPYPLSMDFRLSAANLPVETEELDPRFCIVKNAIRKCWPSEVPWNWAGGDSEALRDLLRLPGWTTDRLTDCIAFRAISEDANHSQSPSRWLDRVTEYAEGPHDRFRKLKAGGYYYWRSQARRLCYGEADEQTLLPLDSIGLRDGQNAREWSERNSVIYRTFCQELNKIYGATIGMTIDGEAAILRAAARAGVPDHIALALVAESA